MQAVNCRFPVPKQAQAAGRLKVSEDIKTEDRCRHSHAWQAIVDACDPVQ